LRKSKIIYTSDIIRNGLHFVRMTKVGTATINEGFGTNLKPDYMKKEFKKEVPY
jgi:hypothetical protein